MSEKLKGKSEKWVAYCVILVIIVCACLWTSACRNDDVLYTPDADSNTHTADASSIDKDLYEAKKTFYEKQISDLNQQVSSLQQEIFFLRAEESTNPENFSMETEKPADSTIDKANVVSKTNIDTEGYLSSDESDTTDTEPMNTDTLKEEDHVLPDEEEKIPLTEKVSNYTFRVENGNALITSYCGNEKEVIIPAAVNGFRVVGICDSAFAYSDIISVEIPETIEKIGWFCFYQCDKLEKVIIPKNISEIGYASFDGCPKNLCLYVFEDSYPEDYAISFGLKFKNIS